VHRRAKTERLGSSKPAIRWVVLFVGGFLLALCLRPVASLGAEYGRLSGVVSDSKGNPLMGATVMVLGPVAMTSGPAGSVVERVITDARGKFAIEHLLPGWYSLKVTSPTRLPAMRNGVRVEAGETATTEFVLSDIFAPVRFQVPDSFVSTWGDDWKWVLRTSSTTRPILRYRQPAEVAEVSAREVKVPLPPSSRLVGMLPGFAPRDPFSVDPGFGSVLAYLRPLSTDSDLLVAGSMAPTSAQTTSVATVLRRNMLKGDPQELALIVHQFSFADGLPLPPGDTRDGLARAQGLVLSYTQTRLLAPGVTVTAGMDVSYLNAAQNVMTTQPHLRVEYQVNRSTMVAVQYGTGRADSTSTLLERVGVLNSFPRVTRRDFHTRLEQLNHTEVSVNHRLSRSARLQLAAYYDSLRNAAVWGFGQPQDMQWLAGNFLPNPAVDGIVLNAGDYRSSGMRAAFSQNIGNRVETLVAYATGDALVPYGRFNYGEYGDPQGFLRAARSSMLAGKVTARLPVTNTRIVTSYEWVQGGRVTTVDPCAQASLQLQPYLGVQIRQPLPTIAFLPAHIEAMADFRNLLAQGYVPVGQSAEKPVLLSSAYRSFRGGFSVQF
jgi:hypothetical protein